MISINEPPTFLPLPGEYIVVQMNPAGMLRPLANPAVDEVFSRLKPLRKYCAVVYKYLEPISPSKPWHTCLLLLLVKNAPSEASSAGTDEDMSFAQSEFRVISARLRTYSSTSIRPGFGRISASGLENAVKRAGGPRTKRRFFLNKYGENRYYSTDEEVSEKACAELAEQLGKTLVPRDSNDMERTKEANEDYAIFLLPHFDFDFNAKQLVRSGELWFSDHAYVLNMLTSVLPGVPERLRIEFTDFKNSSEICHVFPGEEEYWRNYSTKYSESSSKAIVFSSPDTEPRLYVAHLSTYRDETRPWWQSILLYLLCCSPPDADEEVESQEEPQECDERASAEPEHILRDDFTPAQDIDTKSGVNDDQSDSAEPQDENADATKASGSWWWHPFSALKERFRVVVPVSKVA